MTLSRRGVVFGLLAGLALAAAWLGRLDVALALASVKALLIGAELMELRLAARIHLAAYAIWAWVVGLGLWMWTRS